MHRLGGRRRIYFAIAEQLGSSDPFADWPQLSLAIVTFNMTAPMAAWMRFRGMAWRPIAEMAAAMVALALLILAAGWPDRRGHADAPVARPATLMMPAMPSRCRCGRAYTGHAMGAH